MSGREQAPSRLAAWLLGRLIRPEIREGALGDLEEQFRDLAARRGAFRAWFWYWRQVLVVLPGFLRNTIPWSVTMFLNYLKIALRQMNRQKFISFINITGLALGMAACLLIYLWAGHELAYDGFFPNADNIYRVYCEYDVPDQPAQRYSPVTPSAVGPTLTRDFPEVAAAARTCRHYWSISRQDHRFTEPVCLVDPSFFTLFSVEFVAGKRESAFEKITDIVITEELARKYFGAADPLGQTLRVETWYDARITGVVRSFPENTHFRPFGVLIPFDLYKPLWGRDLNDWKTSNYVTYIRLADGASATALAGKIAGLRQPHVTDGTVHLRLQALTDMHTTELGGGGLVVYLNIFALVGAFILLIACVNYMNLATARSSRRAREVGLRKVVGAGRSQLARQFLGEAFLSSLLAAVLAWLAAWLFLPVFNEMTGRELSLVLSWWEIRFLAGIVLLAGLLAGSYPALVLTAVRPVTILRGLTRGLGGGQWLRRGLVVLQFSIAIFLMIGVMVVYGQLDYIDTMDLGFAKEHMITFPLDNELNQSFERFRRLLADHDGIVGVTRTNSPPTYTESTTGGGKIWWEGKPAADTGPSFAVLGVDEAGLDTLGLNLAAGRFFSPDCPADRQDTVVINEAAARAMGLDSPVGKRFRIWDRSATIIGVVKDFHLSSLHRAIDPLVLLPRWGEDTVCIRMTGRDQAGTLAFISDTLRQVVPGFTLEYRFVEHMLAEEYLTEIRSGTILRYATFLAIFISCLGLLGLAAFTAEQRTKEIGIRRVLGASVGSVVTLLSREYFIWVLLANLVAWPLAWWAAARWLESYAYRSDLEFHMFLTAGAAALLIAMLTVGGQAWRAGRANPVRSLRHE